MEDKKNQQPELTPEEQLDALLNSFLSEPDLPMPISEAETEPVVAEDSLPQDEPDANEAKSEPIPEAEAVIPEEASEESTLPEVKPETEIPEDQPLLQDELSGGEEIPETEIKADEDAMESAGLVRPEDLEFEKIIEEAMREEWGEPTVTDGEDAEPEASEQSASEEVTTQEETAVEETTDDRQEAPARPDHKIRPKNRGGYGLFGIPHMVSTVIWLAVIVFIGIGLGTMMWEVASDVLALDRPDHSITITIEEDDDLEEVATKLQQAGLIKYPGLFKLYGNITDAMEDIRPGSFELNSQYDYHALVGHLAGNQSRLTVDVTIPEGYNCAQIFALLEQKGVCSAAKLEEAAANAKLTEYWFLEGVERGTPYCLEGYLFPDTYTFYYSHEPEAVLEKMLSNFNKRFTDIMKNKLDVLNQNLSDMMRSHGLSEEYIASHQMTIREVVIIASMIEKETADNAESYNISSVIYNRLTNPGVYPWLNIDATLVYITGRSPVTDADKLIDSPYNTYLYEGLIPGPISNPSRASLDAALDPEMTEYHFYALDPSTGKHHFSKNLQEHNDFLNSLKKED